MAYTAIPLNKLEGTWYINKSNFKMWLKKNNHNPTFNYAIEKKEGKDGLKDIVAYQKRKASAGSATTTKEIEGFDTALDESNTKFEWRGKGILSLFKSKWEILYFGNDFAIIHFEKTLFTAEGYDVISRQKTLSHPVLNLVDAALKELGIKPELSLITQD
jgi:hypothetical protein